MRKKRVLITGKMTVRGRAQLADAPWPMFRHDLRHTGRSPSAGIQTPYLKWALMTGGAVFSSAAIASDGVVYIGSNDHHVHAVNPNGTVKWKFRTGAQVHSSPALASDGTLYVGSYDGNIYAINSDGTLKWKFPTASSVVSSPAIGSDGTVYVGSHDRSLYALNPDGTLKWKFATGGPLACPPAIGSDGTVYVGAGRGDSHFYAINANGTLKWKFATYFIVDSAPAVATDGTVYMGSYDTNFYALNADGTIKWKFATGDATHSSPAIASDGTVYTGSVDGYLYAFNPDGTLKWKFATRAEVHSPPSIGSDGTVYMGSWDGNLYALGDKADIHWARQWLPYGIGVAAGLLLAYLIIAFRLPQKARSQMRHLSMALRAVVEEPQTLLLRELVGNMGQLEGALHAVKNAVFLFPGSERDLASRREALGAILTAENARAVAEWLETARRSTRRLGESAREIQEALRAVWQPMRDGMGRALEAILRRAGEVSYLGERLQENARDFSRLGRGGASVPAQFLNRAYEQTQQFHALLVNEQRTGLLDLVQQALHSSEIGNVVDRALTVVAERAARQEVTFETSSLDLPLRVPGDPAPLLQTFVDIFNNALDALETQRRGSASLPTPIEGEGRRAEGESRGGASLPALYQGCIRIAMSIGDKHVEVTIADNGCGIAAEMLARLRRGETASTKGAGRGVGLPAARRTIARYGGELDIDSPGPGEGTVVTIRLEYW